MGAGRPGAHPAALTGSGRERAWAPSSPVCFHLCQVGVQGDSRFPGHLSGTPSLGRAPCCRWDSCSQVVSADTLGEAPPHRVGVAFAGGGHRAFLWRLPEEDGHCREASPFPVLRPQRAGSVRGHRGWGLWCPRPVHVQVIRLLRSESRILAGQKVRVVSPVK